MGELGRRKICLVKSEVKVFLLLPNKLNGYIYANDI